MNKSRQKRLLGWLRQQRASGATALRLAALCGFASALVLIAQAWLMATLLQQLVVSDRPRSSLVTQFLLLLFCFLLRAGFNYGREMAGFRAGLAIRRALRRQLLDRIGQFGRRRGARQGRGAVGGLRRRAAAEGPDAAGRRHRGPRSPRG